MEGLLPLHTKLARACFDITVYLKPAGRDPAAVEIARDTKKRGNTVEGVLAELERREPEAEAFIRPQRSHADIVVRFAPIAGRDDPPDTPLSAELLLRPTIRHPDLSGVLSEGDQHAIHLRLARDSDGRPVDALHIHGYAPREESRVVEKGIWSQLKADGGDLPETLGSLGGDERSEPLAITQLLLLYHLLEALERPATPQADR